MSCISVITKCTLTKPVRAVREPFPEAAGIEGAAGADKKKKKTPQCHSVNLHAIKMLPPHALFLAWQRYSDVATPVAQRTDKGSNPSVQYGREWSRQRKNKKCHVTQRGNELADTPIVWPDKLRNMHSACVLRIYSWATRAVLKHLAKNLNSKIPSGLKQRDRCWESMCAYQRWKTTSSKKQDILL